MREVIYKNSFKKELKLMLSRGKDIAKIKKVIELLATDSILPASYKDHPMTGNFSTFRDIHVEPDWILIYKKRSSTEEYKNGVLFLEATGTHSDLF